MSRRASVGEDRPRRLVVLAGPTAVGKGTLSAHVRDNFPEVWLSVSATTRSPRPGEVEGVHYHFVDEAEFSRMEQAGELLESAVVHGRNHYGTPRAPVERALREHRMALLESMPGVGRVRARQIMEEVGISESRRVRGLGTNQISALLTRFDEA